MQMNSENDLEQESREKIAEAAGKPEQPRKEMRRNIRRASNRKILRRQMELLAEYSRTDYQYDSPIPASSEAMASVHRELIKAENRLLMGLLITLFGFLHLLKRFKVERIQFIKR